VDDRLHVTGSCAIALDELEWRFTGAGGPGGQHANTANTKVELRWDVASSRSLGPRQRERLLARLGPVVRVVVASERSQARNRALALDRLRARVADALRVRPPRVATRPTARARAARVAEKRRRGDVKRNRRPPPSPEE